MAKDVTQEVMIRFQKYLGKCDPERDFSQWLNRITLNVCRNMLKRHSGYELIPLNANLSAKPSASSNPEMYMLEKGLRDQFVTALKVLSYKERVSIVLREVEGMSTNEVAAIMQVSESTVRTHILRARAENCPNVDRDSLEINR